MTTVVLISIAAIGLLFSLFKSRSKTVETLKLTRSLLSSIFSQMISIMALIGLLLALIPPETIKKLLGSSSRLMSTFWGAIIGTVTIIPGFIAFPLSKSLYQSGAYLMAIAAFITTLTMVGFATSPIEIKYFGKKFTLYRNVLSFVLAMFIATGIGVIL